MLAKCKVCEANCMFDYEERFGCCPKCLLSQLHEKLDGEPVSGQIGVDDVLLALVNVVTKPKKQYSLIMIHGSNGGNRVLCVLPTTAKDGSPQANVFIRRKNKEALEDVITGHMDALSPHVKQITVESDNDGIDIWFSTDEFWKLFHIAYLMGWGTNMRLINKETNQEIHDPGQLFSIIKTIPEESLKP